MEFSHCISLSGALQLVLSHLPETVVGMETLPLPECLGRTVAVDIVSKEDLPLFSRSTVDGFAVRSADTFGAAEGVPVLLNLIGEVLMGKQTDLSVQSGQAAAMPTGGKLPQGADAVVMVEYTENPDQHSLLVLKAVAPGENVIVKGEDFKINGVILRRGQIISPQVMGALAACGYSSVAVRKKPEVAIISTGDEVVDVGEVIAGSQIRDINSYVLAAMLEQAGCSVRRCGIVPDSYEALKTAMIEALTGSQMVLISGGSSVGTRDHTVRVIQSFEQASVFLHGIAVKPGKPTIFGKVGGVPVFGLPGHPVSAMTICQSLVKPAIAALLGHEQLEPKHRIIARITRNVASAPGRDDFIRVKLLRRDGDYWAEPIFGKSGLISTYLEADGIVHIGDMKSGLYGEDWVEVELVK
jgi:molybdopterin molybdotransferase